MGELHSTDISHGQRQARSRVYDSGDFCSLNTVALLLARMKELAVVTVHKSVHLRNLVKMVQQSKENI